MIVWDSIDILLLFQRIAWLNNEAFLLTVRATFAKTTPTQRQLQTFHIDKTEDVNVSARTVKRPTCYANPSCIVRGDGQQGI